MLLHFYQENILSYLNNEKNGEMHIDQLSSKFITEIGSGALGGYLKKSSPNFVTSDKARNGNWKITKSGIEQLVFLQSQKPSTIPTKVDKRVEGDIARSNDDDVSNKSPTSTRGIQHRKHCYSLLCETSKDRAVAMAAKREREKME